MWHSDKVRLATITLALLLVALPGYSCLLWLTQSIRMFDGWFGNLLVGETILIKVAALFEPVSSDLSQIKGLELGPFAFAAALTYFLPTDRTFALKIFGLLACSVGYLVYLELSSVIGTLTDINTTIETLFEPGFGNAATKIAAVREKFTAIKTVTDSVRICYAIIGGALFGIRIEKRA